jgi:dipeptidyl-peptidase-4
VRDSNQESGSLAIALAVAAFALALAPAPVQAQSLPKLTIERLHDDPPLSGTLPTRLAWHPDGKRLTFLRASGTSVRLCAFDVTKGEEAVLLDAARLRVPGDDSRRLSLAAASWLPDGKRLLVPSEGDIFVVDVGAGAVRTLVETPEAEEFATASPDGTRVAFVRGNDLYAVDISSRLETRLTRNGSDTLLNGRLDWVYEEELAPRSGQAFVWSPDSQSLAYLQLDQARVPTFPIVDFLPVRNEVKWQRYPTPGSPNAIARVGIAAIGKDGAVATEHLVSFQPDDAYLLPQLGWTPDSRNVAIQRLNRAQNELELRLVSISTSAREPLGGGRILLTERSTTWLDTFGAPRFLKDGRRFLWVSEREGFAHLYVCDLAGSCRTVTQGSWAVESRVSFALPTTPYLFEDRSGFLYFTATEKDPRERHLYRVRLDGTGRTRLTREDGVHRVLVSPDGRFYADTWSNTETPPKLTVSSQDGTRHWTIEDNAHPPILDFERGRIEPVELAAQDGTKLYAALLTPADFDPGKRYPVIVNVYGGPHAQTVTNAWSQASAFDQLLASRGFLVFWLDNRGSAGRGTAFESPIHGQLGRVELEDQLAGITHLRSLPFVDPSRIGITGWSYGGYLALYAATNAPDVFRAVVAGAPVTDWRFYDSIYAERYLGTPEANPKSYDASSPIQKAAALEADLLLLHGTADDNVHLANTVSFVAALVRAGKPYSLVLHPRQSHGLSGKEDRTARDKATLAHFERTLEPRE